MHNRTLDFSLDILRALCSQLHYTHHTYNSICLHPCRYKENTMRLSRIHHDRPIKPLDEAVFWIEFVIRNKGANHLRVEAYNLTWYQYHCLDVIAFFITILTVVLYVFFKMCKFFIMRCCFRSKRKSKKEWYRNWHSSYIQNCASWAR